MRAKPAVLKHLNLQSLRKRFGMRPPGRVTALDVDGQVLRVVLSVPRGNRSAVTRIAAERLDLAADADRSDPAVMGKAIAKAMERLRLHPAQVVMGVPRASVVLRTLTLPDLADIRELASMVHFQLGRDLPFRMDEAVIDFRVLRKVPAAERTEPAPKAEDSDEEDVAKPETSAAPDKVELLVAAVRREVVEFYEQMAAAAGLKLASLGLLSIANARCVEACEVAQGEEAVALVSLRPDEVGIDVVARQSLLFSRGAALKSRPEPLSAAETESPGAPNAGETPETAATGAPAAPETLVEAATIEVVRSLHSYGGMEPQNPVAQVVVAGSTGHEPALVDTLQARLSTPCTWLDVAGALELPRAAREHAAGSISAIGLALGVHDPQRLPFDFLSPKRPAVQRNLRRIRLIMTAVGVAALVMFLAGLSSQLKRQREQVRDQVQKELAEAKKKQPVYRAMRIQAASIQDWVKGGRKWLEHYAYLTAVLPPCEDIYISGFGVNVQGKLTLSVQARSSGILDNLDKKLREAGYEVKPLAVHPGKDKYGYDFRSSVELEVSDKLKIDLTKVRPAPRPADDGSLDRSRIRGGAG